MGEEVLIMDTNDEALKPAESENSQPDSPKVEETAVEPNQAEAESAPVEADQVPEDEVQTEEAPKKGAQARIKELVAEKASLAKKIAELTNVEPQAPTYNPTQLEPIVAEGEQLTADELNRRIAKRDVTLLQQADALAQIRTRQGRMVENINKEALEATAKYKQLDPDSEEFDKELSDTVTEATEAYIKSSPNPSVKTFVNKLMKPYLNSVTKEVAKQSENLAKQASETALRPSNVKPVDKKFEDLSIKEMESKLGIVH
jgi:hypothetical protein